MADAKSRVVWTGAVLFGLAFFAVTVRVVWEVSSFDTHAPPASIVALPVRLSAAAAAVQARAETADYQRAVWDQLHSFPASASTSNEECLVCHREILSSRPREASPAGVRAVDALAWYQTLDTYAGDQQSFHWRHLQSPLARDVMNLACNFCHQANDPRERSPHVARVRSNPEPANATQATEPASAAASFSPAFTLRKTVNPTETCLRCHGAFPGQVMGLPEPWPAMREGLETPETPNGCLTCHAETFRTVRHQVNYLRAAGIERAARTSSDVCFGCHGGRQWYRISYPYPRHAWPGMPEEIPDWAQTRPQASDPRFALPARHPAMPERR